MPRLRDPRTGVIVNVDDDTASRLGWGPAAGPQPVRQTAEGMSGGGPSTCPDCGFVAKTAAGLGAHRRKHDS